MIRCGGWVDHGDGKGWVLYVPGPPAGESTPASVEQEPPPDPQLEQAADGQPDKASCPDCGREFAVNKDGSLRKHTCVIGAPAVEVTFGDGPG
jgi:hypothetical protein